MKTNQNGFAAVLVVLIAAVALIGVSAYFYLTRTVAPVAQNESVVQPATQVLASDTANWKTYRSDEWGIEIKYPEMIYQKDNWCDKETVECFISFEEAKNKGQILDWPSITIGSVMTALSPRAWIEKNQLNVLQAENQKTTLNDIKVGSEQASGVEFASALTAGGSKNIVIQGRNSNLLEFSLNSSPNGEIAPAIFDQMLSTFKFINSQVVTAKTEIITYQPHRDGVTQYKTIDGDCSVGSEAANRADAYRCITSNEISDPCFVLPNEKLLICGVDIATGNGGFLLQPAKVLPKGELWKNNIQGWAMRFQLISGEICSFMGGATAGNAKGERLNYQCGDSKNLSVAIYGDLTEGDVWTANVSNIEYDATKKVWNVLSVKTVDIAKVWR